MKSIRDRNIIIVYSARPNIVLVVHMILYDIDAIGPNLGVHNKKTTHTAHCCLSHPSLLVGDYDKSPVQQRTRPLQHR
jgi:hypothetical protein